MKFSTLKLVTLFSALVIISQSGCAVPQKKGHGLCTHQIESETKAGYWLYLPDDYVKNNGQHPNNERWPMVITFHGLKPYDNAGPQIREWQEEADRYGFIVIAPELRTCDSLTMQFPLRDPNLSYVQADEKATIAIMDEVCRLTNADPRRVLATSFSSGGYMAHFMVNRYPERFHCIAVRGSNFSEALLNPAQVSKYRDMKIGIFFGENDFKVCREESTRAVGWYRQRRFDVIARQVKGLGHERTPQTAAALFASTIGATPKTPPKLGQMVVLDIHGDKGRGIARREINRRPPPRPIPQSTNSRIQSIKRYSPNQEIIANPKPIIPPQRKADKNPTQVTPKKPISRTPSPIRHTPRQSATPKRPIRQPYSSIQPPARRTSKRNNASPAPAREQIKLAPINARIRVKGNKLGTAPMWVYMSVEMPLKLREGASILWTDNNKPISSGTFNANSILRRPGNHIIKALITTADDRRIILHQTIKVLSAPSSQPAES
ncbi:MAG: hypothetical protein JSV03_02435 [Planctomycetota bacterium]|nr:MAG: hypothetical protein JSV03_02435 [Planctomycetota bacterium]